MTNPTLASVVRLLKDCPRRHRGANADRLLVLWENFRLFKPECGTDVTPALLAGLLLYDRELAIALLPEGEFSQLTALVQTAYQRFLDHNHHPIGQNLAAALKESI